MAEEVKPALTAEEWATLRKQGRVVVGCDNVSATITTAIPGHSPLAHSIAAVALHGQPFGFTREDVAIVRECVEHLGCNCGENSCHDHLDTKAADDLLRSLAARIEALLPPETPTNG